MHLLLSLLCCFCLTRAQILIKNGVVVNADRQFEADVYIEGGTIIKVGPSLEVGNRVKVIDAHGMMVMPGGIDPHTHLEMPFMGQTACDDFYSGQAAALAGGTTMHIDFALPLDGDLIKGFENYKVSNDMQHLVENGVNSFKFFMAYKGALMVSDEELILGFERCKALGAVPMVHAENGDAVAYGQARVFDAGITAPEGHALSRPSELEAEATNRAIRLAEFVNVPLYVVHVMSASAMHEVHQAKLRGHPVIGEPLAVGLSMNGNKIKDKDFKIAAQYVMSPPIRTDEDRAALKAALVGGILDLTGTDHAVFNSSQKAVGRHDFRRIPNGVNSIEERMHIIWDEMVQTGLMSPMDYVRVTSTQAAKIFNIYPQKGVIEAGADADVILLDPAVEHVIRAQQHHSRMDTNIYEGRRIKGKVMVTISRGRVVWENEKLNVQPSTGRFIPMEPFSYLYKKPFLKDTSSFPASQKVEL